MPEPIVHECPDCGPRVHGRSISARDWDSAITVGLARYVADQQARGGTIRQQTWNHLRWHLARIEEYDNALWAGVERV